MVLYTPLKGNTTMNNTLKKAMSKIHITSLHLENNLITRFNLKKTYNIKSINKETLINIVDYSINYEKLNNTYANEELNNFINFITNKFTKEELVLFYRNINSLNIENNKNTCFKYATSTYNVLENKIVISDKKFIYHELFHMITAIYTKDSIICGFWQYNETLDDGIGEGINEGYTQLLTEKYFQASNDNLKDDYTYETMVAKCLEIILGEEEMEKLYINANLQGLIDNLNNYINMKTVMSFINKLDYVTLNRYNDNLSTYTKKKIIDYIEDINTILICIYNIKLKKENLTKQEYNEKLTNYISLFNNKIFIGGKSNNPSKLININKVIIKL